jgi:CheY-like chemotaxis protein
METKPNVLIVDDDEQTVQLFRTIFEIEGCHTLGAYDGRQALDAIQSNSINLIVLDIMMPDIDGLTVCRTLKQDPANAHIPVIIITALIDPLSQENGYKAGADVFLTKPINCSQLVAIARQKMGVALPC